MSSMASSLTTTANPRHSNQTTCQTGASSETLHLLSSQLQSLPQQQLTSLLIQAISANSSQTITPTSGTTSGTPISTTATSTSIPASTQTTTFNLMPQPLPASTPFTQTDPDDRLSEASGHVPPSQPSTANLHLVEPDTQVSSLPSVPTISTAIPLLSTPIPSRLRTRIQAGEYVDFNTLLTHAMVFTRDGSHIQQHAQTFTLQMSPHNGELQLAPTPTHSKKINSFAQWMEAWNIYVSTLLLAKPSKALEMLGYQRIIASLNLRFPITTWMTYDIKFRTLAASYPSLRWDIRHLDTWVECISMPKSQPERWPCPHCGSMYHYPQRCPFRAGSSSTDATRQLPITGHATHSPAPQPAPTISSQSHLPQQLSPICRDFNNRRSCPRANCFFRHVCLQCYGPHPQYACQTTQVGQLAPRQR